MRFDKQRIVAVTPEEHLRRSLEFLKRLGKIHPLLENWFLQGRSSKAALNHDVIKNPEHLAAAIEKASSRLAPANVTYSVWNGEASALKGGMVFRYFAHNQEALSYMEFVDIGSLVAASPDRVRTVTVAMIGAAVELWPEIDWASPAPDDYFLYDKRYKERQTSGWIGFCPHPLRQKDFPEACELRAVAGRGTIIVNCQDIMDDKNASHIAAVEKADTVLVEKGLLPLYNN